jgi:hypothetical protein
VPGTAGGAEAVSVNAVFDNAKPISLTKVY